MSLLPPDWRETVVAIGSRDRKGKFTAHSTGFLVGTKEDGSGGADEIFLVTNRHVFDRRSSVIVRFGDKEIEIHLKGNEGNIWTNHKNRNVDIAVVIIPEKERRRLKLSIMYSPENELAPTDIMERENITVGNEVFVLGFPLGIAGVGKNFPIVRNGIIARLDEEILKSHCYYVDVAIYGGNSGGPVISKPEPPTVNELYVIGVVSAFVPDRQTLYGVRNGVYEPRMDIYQNANLGVIVPIEYVLETIELLRDKIKQGQLLPSKKKS